MEVLGNAVSKFRGSSLPCYIGVLYTEAIVWEYHVVQQEGLCGLQDDPEYLS